MEPTISYDKMYWDLVVARECSLPDGMQYIMDTEEQNYPVLLEVCVDAGYTCYVPYVKERTEQLIEWWSLL